VKEKRGGNGKREEGIMKEESRGKGKRKKGL
jgi:hypothetical protein